MIWHQNICNGRFFVTRTRNAWLERFRQYKQQEFPHSTRFTLYCLRCTARFIPRWLPIGAVPRDVTYKKHQVQIKSQINLKYILSIKAHCQTKILSDNFFWKPCFNNHFLIAITIWSEKGSMCSSTQFRLN